MPVMFEEQVLGVIELGALRPFSEVNQAFLDQLADTIGVVINTIQANMRTEQLLTQSQALTQELQKQSLELRQTNDELQDKTLVLQQQNRDIEIKNAEIELARAGLEEKAAQLALSSKYKSEFLANMSHELRTPLNSLLILSRMLAENGDGNLHPQQIEFAETIHAAGNDLLALINDILDLSKVEAGKMELNLGPLALVDLCEDVERAFRPVAEQNALEFRIERDHALPPALVTDEQRLQQVLRNLLSNAFKFTQKGTVTLHIGPDEDGTVGFAVIDTGVGIPEDKLSLDLRGLPAGRRHDVAQVRRHRPGPVDLARDRPPAGRRAARAVDAGRGLELHARAAAGRRDGHRRRRPSRPSPPRCPARRPTSSRPPRCCPSTAPTTTAPSIVAGDRVLLIIAHDAELAARRARRGARAQLPLPRRPPRRRSAWRWPASTAPRRCSSSPPTAAARSCSASSSSIPRPATARSSSPARRAGGCRRCAPAPPATSRAPAGPRPSTHVAQALDEFNARAVRRLALIEDGTELDPATMTLLGAGEDVDVMHVPFDKALEQLRADGADCAVLPVSDGGAEAFALLEQAARRRRPARAADRRLRRRAAGGAATARAWISSPPRSTPRPSPPRSGWSTRPRCTCTAWRRACRPRRASCSRSCARPTRSSTASGSSSSTTTSATSSRSRARWRCAA